MSLGWVRALGGVALGPPGRAFGMLPAHGFRVPLTKARRSQRELDALRAIQRSLDRLEPGAARTIGAALRDVKGAVSLERIRTAIDTGNLSGVLSIDEVLDLASKLGAGSPGGASREPSEFAEFMTGAYQGGARTGESAFARTEASAVFDIVNPRAVDFVTRSAFELVQGINDDSRTAIRASLQRSFQDGHGAIQAAREIRDSIGLTDQFADAVYNFRQQLETGTQQGTTPPWKRRLTATDQARAMRVMKDPGRSQDEIDALVDRYAAKLIDRRAQNIARTELSRAYAEGQREFWGEAIDQGYVEPDEIRRFWVVTDDERLRDSHREIPSMNPQGVGLAEPFETPEGPAMGPEAFINCRCTVVVALGEGGA